MWSLSPSRLLSPPAVDFFLSSTVQQLNHTAVGQEALSSGVVEADQWVSGEVGLMQLPVEVQHSLCSSLGERYSYTEMWTPRNMKLSILSASSSSM